jgi:hypothetical protein
MVTSVVEQCNPVSQLVCRAIKELLCASTLCLAASPGQVNGSITFVFKRVIVLQS